MHAIDLLTQRQSNAALQTPAPSPEHLSIILTSGMKVPDHGCLSPWHFTVIKEQGLTRLSEIFLQAIENKHYDEAKRIKTSKMPFRAPLIIAISTRLKQHDKVPKQEQIIAAGCTVHAMQMAAFSLGYGAIWRTGELSYNALVKEKLNIASEDEIVGFLYIGTKSKEMPNKPVKPYEENVSYL